MDKKALLAGCFFGLFAVAIGAFGAHGLKELLVANNRLDVFETAVKYQFYHAFALLISGLLADKLQIRWMTIAIICFSVGVVVFSGSLYVLAITNIAWLGAVTPFGGVLLIIGWGAMIIGIKNWNK